MPDWRAIFDAEPCLPLKWFAGHGAGGKMLTDGADHLLVNIGVHQADLWLARPTSDPASHLGKLLRIAIETGETETLAMGFRNSQGLARDAEGNLWATDHGPQGGDELNLVERGGNYGWPLVSYGVDYEDKVPLTIEDEAMAPARWLPAAGVRMGSVARRFRHCRQRRAVVPPVERRPAGCFAARSFTLPSPPSRDGRAVRREDRNRLAHSRPDVHAGRTHSPAAR